jgi:hypothetical protein
MPDDKQKIEIILKDEPCFVQEDGEMFYNLGSSLEEGANVCREVLKTLGIIE